MMMTRALQAYGRVARTIKEASRQREAPESE